MASLNNLKWTPLSDDGAQVGDLVSADAGGMPIYRVVAVKDGGLARLIGEMNAQTLETSLARFAWKVAGRD